MADTLNYQIDRIQEDYRRFVYDGIKALIVPVQVSKGYGVLKPGMVMAKNVSAAGGKNEMVPYNPTTISTNDPGRTFVTQDVGDGATELYVKLELSYRFRVGDDIIIKADSQSAQNLGAITDIDRTSSDIEAKITITSAVSGAAMTMAAHACLTVEAGDSSNAYSDAFGVLVSGVDTGEGENAAGASVGMYVKNCVFYAGAMINMDTAAKTDLGVKEIGNFIII